LGAGDVARGHNAAKRGIDVSLETFLAALAERTPAPGGGSAAAAGCALGAALAEMAARFAGRDDDAARAAGLVAEALRLGEADLTSYAPVLEAQRAGDPERAAAARAAAAEVPLAIAETAAQVAELARALAVAGRPGLRGDALAGADLAAGAARAAARLVEINLADDLGGPRVVRARAAVARASGAG
jgi:formiminotetrahydrofolate cyclodeaminase